jgi:CheY-like chemotaxis protein
MTHQAGSVLVLDDDDDGRFLTVHALKKRLQSMRILEARTVAEALALAANHAPKLIITDHHLGAGCGIAFLESLKSCHVGCPVVMLTANSDPKVHQKAFAAGAAKVMVTGQSDFASEVARMLDADSAAH